MQHFVQCICDINFIFNFENSWAQFHVSSNIGINTHCILTFSLFMKPKNVISQAHIIVISKCPILFPRYTNLKACTKILLKPIHVLGNSKFSVCLWRRCWMVFPCSIISTRIFHLLSFNRLYLRQKLPCTELTLNGFTYPNKRP